MGSCQSNLNECHGDVAGLNSGMSREERSRNRQMEHDMKEDFSREKDTIKLLLLGAAQSGKTTILKQMKLLHPMQHR